ncbi:MAG: DMT family transporter [Actinomycetota bacterium]|nr:DMT family transporter [Actinomycetota bacterium]
MPPRHENKGALLALLSAAMWGAFPVIVNRGSRKMPPLLFAAFSTLFAATGAFVYALIKGKLNELRKKDAYFSLLMVTLLIVIVPYTLFFIGTSKTSGLNTSLLLMIEIIFTLLFTHFIGEKTTAEKLAGGIGVFIGAVFILYNGQKGFRANTGDLLIIASTVTYPIGNFYAKKALGMVSPPVILFVRFFFGGLFMAVLAVTFEANTVKGAPGIMRANWPMLLFTGLVLLGVCKILWYEALDRLDISKAISLVMTFPLFSLAILVGLYGEPVSRYQWAGAAVMMIGVFFTIRRRSVEPHLTKYGQGPE